MASRLWTLVLFLASADYTNSAPYTINLNRSCPYHNSCNPTINQRHIERLMSYVDSERQPCEDFYAYACGKWREKHGSDATATTISEAQINDNYEELFAELRHNASYFEFPMYRKLATHFQDCLALGKPNLGRYLELLDQKHQASLKTTHWSELLAILGQYGYHGHFVLLEVRWHNASHHMLFLLPHNHHLSLNLTPDIYDALSRHGLSDGAWPPYEQLREQFRLLEQNLSSLERSKIPDDSFTHRSLKEIRAEVPGVEWDQILRQQLNRSVGDNQAFQVDDLAAIKRLVEYLNQANNLLLNRYSLARFLSHLVSLPHNPLADWSTESKSLSLRCIRHMRRSLYLPMNYVYEHRFYAHRRRADELVIHRVFEQLRGQLERNLDNNPFNLSQDLVSSLKDKVHFMRINVGNLPPNVSDQFYWEVDRRWVVGRDFYENHLNSLLYYYSVVSDLEGTTNQTEREIWYSFNMHQPEFPDNIDATPYFYCLGDIIFVPYSYVRLPFFHADFWPALLYGDLANTLGHEMMHALDTDLVDYDAWGHMSNFSDQLGLVPSYTDAVRCLNDSAVMLNERTSDVSGSRLALNTYGGEWMENPDDGRLYFLQFAHFFCGDEGDIYHDTGSQRLNYALSQVPKFAEVFGCQSGTVMNSADQCRFW
ncbi:hypothetical protein KR038_003295 [Drosophila bunnanda]|nr:hypothetical protein KR038_003295 [Drosophila bunnanda]